MIYTVTFNPSLDYIVEVPSFQMGMTNRTTSESIFPGGKGSSVVQMDGLYKLELNGAAPLGFIVREPDTVLVSTAIIMEIPMVDRVEDEFYNAVKTGDQIEINADEETITLIEQDH